MREIKNEIINRYVEADNGRNTFQEMHVISNCVDFLGENMS